jgi:Tol biopolymer transport system component
VHRATLVAGAAAFIVVGLLSVLVSQSMWPRPAPAIGTAIRISPVTTYPGNEFGPAVSPDGSRAAFMWNDGTERTQIYVAPIGPGAPQRLSRGESGNDRDPAWSPDSNWIAFLREHDPTRLDLMAIPSFGGQERKLASVRVASRDGFPLIAWTPDSRSILFTTQREGSDTAPAYGFHLLELTTGATREFDSAVSPKDYDTSPAFSPDGRWLAFTRYHISERLPDMMVQELGDRYVPRAAPRIVPGTQPGVLFSPSWSPDSTRLIFINDRNVLEWPVGGTARTVHAMAESSNLRTAPRRLGGVAMYWRNGRMSAVASVAQVNPELWVLPIDPETHIAIGPPRVRVSSKSAERHPAFSPDGKWLAFVSGRSGQMSLWLSYANGENPQPLSNLPAYVTGYPTWSPDSKQIAFHTSGVNEDRVIYSIDVDGGAPRRLFNGCCPGGWSADGRALYVSEIGAIHTVVRARVHDGRREPLFPGLGAVESVDGKRLLYAKSDEFGIFSRTLDANLVTNKEEPLVRDYIAKSNHIVPTVGGFFYLGATPSGRPRAFRFFDFAASAAHDVATAPPSAALGLAVSPDGRELVYSADAVGDDADLQLIEFGQ